MTIPPRRRPLPPAGTAVGPAAAVLLASPASAAPDAETALATRDAIDRALAELPDELRTALVLRDVEGLDYKEIAGVTGAPLGTVESRIFRARRRLRTLLRPLAAARPPRGAAAGGKPRPRAPRRRTSRPESQFPSASRRCTIASRKSKTTLRASR